jgi:hypothetical protein
MTSSLIVRSILRNSILLLFILSLVQIVVGCLEFFLNQDLAEALIKLKSKMSDIIRFRQHEYEYADDELVRILAMEAEVSEYEIFERAARVWNREGSVHEAFKKYLFTGNMPWWVREYVRY